MKNIIKSFDFYKRDLTIPVNNSLLRGIFSILVAVLFITINIYFICKNILYPQPKEIKDTNYINKEMIDFRNLDFKVYIEIDEYYINKNFSICDFYVETYDKNRTYFNIAENYNITSSDFKNDEDNEDIHITHRLLNLTFKYNFSTIRSDDSWSKPGTYFYFDINKNCKDTYDGMRDRSIKIITNQNVTTNKFNIKSNEVFNHESFKNMYYTNSTTIENIFESINHFELNLLYDDYKGYLDFNSEYSSFFTNNYNKNNSTFLKTSNHMFDHYKVEDSAEIGLFFTTLLTYKFYIKNVCKINMRVYDHFLIYFPMFLSIFSSIIKGFSIIHLIMQHNYKYFEFINNTCRIKYSDMDCDINSDIKGSNYIRKHYNNNWNESIDTMKESEVGSKDNKILFERKTNSINSKSNNIAFGTIKIDDYKNTGNIKNSSIDKEISTPNFDTSLLIKPKKKFSHDTNTYNRKSHLELRKTSNYIQYSISDAFCFFLPFTCCRSSKANTKLRILSDVKEKLNSVDPSFYTMTNNTTTYLMHMNLLKIYGKDELFKPIFTYDLENYDDLD